MTEHAGKGRRRFLQHAATATGTLLGTGFAAGPVAAAPARRWDREADVVIVGSGIAGICAAIEAADAGAKVIVLEKDDQPGGCAKFSGGHMTVAGSHVQARAKVEDHPDWLYNDMIEDGEGTAVPELIRHYVDGSGPHIQWLENLGVRFSDQFQYSSNADRIKPGVARGHMIAKSPDYPGGPHNGGLGLMLMLLRAAEKRGVTVLLRHAMTRILRDDPNGPVPGVEATAKGATVNIRATRGVIVTTGGWTAHLAMGLAEDPRLTAEIVPDCWPYRLCTGTGHTMAVDAGGMLSNMAFGSYLVPRWGSKVYQIWEPPTFENVPSIFTGVPISNFERVMLVRGDARRFVDESQGNPAGQPHPRNAKFSVTPSSYVDHPFIQAYLNLRERPRNVWALTDAAGAKALQWPLDEMRNPRPREGRALYPDMVVVAETLAELAAKTGLDAAALEASVARYNGFATSGTDEEFGKSKLAGLSGAPYCAAKMVLIKHTCRNGIRVNTRGQIIDRRALAAGDPATAAPALDQQVVVPRLYAAGECAHYLGRYHGHGTLGIYSYFGRVAGRQAAAEKRQA